MDSKPSNQQKIYEDINDLFRSIIQKRNSGDLKKFFDFLKDNPHQAPFNNALVFAQRPECVYYMTAQQWKSIHDQEIKVGVRPMIILYPFGPVSFVYDYESTEGPYSFDKNTCLDWFKEKQYNCFTPNIFEKTVRYMEKTYQVPLVCKEPGEYLKRHSLSTGGYATFSTSKLEITLNPRYFPIISSNVTEAYGVLIHEIAHILLGHLGPQRYYVMRQGEKLKMRLGEDRGTISDSVCELEAELAAWMVFNRFGVTKNSIDYLASFLNNFNDWEDINMSYILRIANTIFEMRK